MAGADPFSDDYWLLPDVATTANAESMDNFDAKINALESENQELRDQVKERKFVIAILLVALLDVLLFEKFISSGTAIVVFAIPQAVFLFIYARRCGIEEIKDVVDQVLGCFQGKS